MAGLWRAHKRGDEVCIGCEGQSTVEFAVVTAVLLCVVIGLSAFWRLAGQGVIAEHATKAASHHVEGSASAVADVFSY